MTSITSLEREQQREARRIKHRSWVTSYLMILPAMAFLVAFVIYPTISMAHMSLYYGNAKNPYKKWMALGNYSMRDDFWVALRNTAAYTGTELHRRTVGMAQVKDVNTIADPEKRAYAKKLNIIAGKDYILNRESFFDGQSFTDAVKRAEAALK